VKVISQGHQKTQTHTTADERQRESLNSQSNETHSLLTFMVYWAKTSYVKGDRGNNEINVFLNIPKQ